MEYDIDEIDNEPVKNYSWRAGLLTLVAPVFLTLWSASYTFAQLCSGSCSYSEYLMLAASVEYISTALSLIILLTILYWVSLAWENKSQRLVAIVVFVINIIITSFFASGYLLEIIEDIATHF